MNFRLRPAASTTQTLRRAPTAARDLLRSEVASSIVLGLAIVAALIWANSTQQYERAWSTPLRITLGSHTVAHPLRDWVNSGLMTLFFVIVGLEARREFDLGELRSRRRVIVPVVTGLTAMLLPALIYLAVTAGRPHSAGGWGVAISTDTAFALGGLTLAARGSAERLRVFLLTVLVVDDLVSVVVVAVAYSDSVQWLRILVAVVAYVAFAFMLRAGLSWTPAYVVAGFATWAALFGSGVDPIAAGLAMGLLATAYPPRRNSLEQATATFRTFREEPTADLARSATLAVTATQSPNDRLRRFYLPWTSFVIVPLFALANAGVAVDGTALRHAAASALTWGVLLAFALGKPLGYLLSAVLVRLLSRGEAPSPVGPVGLGVAGLAAAAPFTLSLLIADQAFSGPALNDVKTGVLAAMLVSLTASGVAMRRLRRSPAALRARALQGDGFVLTDLQDDVDESVDHARGALDADVTIVEYGDFECPHCGLAEIGARAELSEDARVRYVWRHLPLVEVHPHAWLAARAAEAAGRQGRFWEMHDRLLVRQDELLRPDLLEHAEQLGLDVERFDADLDSDEVCRRVRRDLESAEDSDVSGTPTFFVNGRRHYGGYDLDSIRESVREARQRLLATAGRS